jgi:hypothetical protein
MLRDAVNELQKKVSEEAVLAKVAVVERLELIANNDDDRNDERKQSALFY